MKLSVSQQRLHWALWKRAKAKLMPGRETWTKHEENEHRHAIYIQALGDDKSLTEMDNEDFDLVLGALRAIIDPSNLNAQLHALNGQRKRLMFGIRKLARSLGVDDGKSGSDFYVAGIVRTMNAEGTLGGSDLEELHPKDLTKVMIALRKHEARGCVHVQTSNTQRVAHLETAPGRSPEPCLAGETSEPDPF